MARSQPRREDYFCNPTVHERCSLGAPVLLYTVVIIHLILHVSLCTRESHSKHLIRNLFSIWVKISCRNYSNSPLWTTTTFTFSNHLPSRKYTTLLRFRVPHQKPLTTHEILRASMPQMHDVLRPTKNQIPQMDLQMLQHQTIRR